MKLVINAVLIVVAAGVGLAIGFVWRGNGKSQSPATTVTTTTSPTITAAKGSAGHRAGIATSDDSPLVTQLKRDLSMSSGVTRWLYWLEALEKAKPGDFPRLALLAKNNPAALRFVAARWIEIAPRHLFDTLIAGSRNGGGLPVRELEQSLLNDWPKNDPEGAVAALNEPGDWGRRSEWRHQVTGRIIETDAERGLILFSEWHIDNYGPRMTGIAKWAAADPQHAAEFTLEHPAGYASQMAMETIGKEWGKSDPNSALAFAASKPGDLGSMLANSALKQWAGQDLNSAADWLAGVDAETRNRLSPAFVETWAKQDAGSALTWCQENLSGSSLSQAVGGVLTGAAAKDVAAAAALVAGMDPSPARAEGAAAVANKWFPDSFSGNTVKPDTLSWLGSLDADSVKRALDKVTWTWATSDPKSMAAFLANSSAESIPTWTYSTLARELARQNPLDAIAWASQQGADRSVSVGSDAFAEWWHSRPDQAMAWLNDLPTTDARRQPFLQSAVRVMAYDTGAVAQLAAISDSDRATARDVIKSMTLPEDKRSRLLEALAKQ